MISEFLFLRWVRKAIQHHEDRRFLTVGHSDMLDGKILAYIECRDRIREQALRKFKDARWVAHQARGYEKGYLYKKIRAAYNCLQSRATATAKQHLADVIEKRARKVLIAGVLIVLTGGSLLAVDCSGPMACGFGPADGGCSEWPICQPMPETGNCVEISAGRLGSCFDGPVQCRENNIGTCSCRAGRPGVARVYSCTPSGPGPACGVGAAACNAGAPCCAGLVCGGGGTCEAPPVTPPPGPSGDCACAASEYWGQQFLFSDPTPPYAAHFGAFQCLSCGGSDCNPCFITPPPVVPPVVPPPPPPVVPPPVVPPIVPPVVPPVVPPPPPVVPPPLGTCPTDDSVCGSVRATTNGMPLANRLFELLDSTGKPKATKMSDELGLVDFGPRAPGTWFIRVIVSRLENATPGQRSVHVGPTPTLAADFTAMVNAKVKFSGLKSGTSVLITHSAYSGVQAPGTGEGIPFYSATAGESGKTVLEPRAGHAVWLTCWIPQIQNQRTRFVRRPERGSVLLAESGAPLQTYEATCQQ